MNTELKEKFDLLVDNKFAADYWADEKRPEYFIKSLEGHYFGDICCSMGRSRGEAEAYINAIYFLEKQGIDIPDELFELANNAITLYNSVYGS